MQINHQAPVITHLTFINDFFLISEDSFGTMEKIKEIFNIYGSCLGQLVNFNKSGIYFSMNLSLYPTWSSSNHWRRVDASWYSLPQ